MIPLPDCVRIESPSEDYPILEINHSSCRARVAFNGAHVMEWTPAGQEPVLYLSPTTFLENGKPIRGGIPLCWPWFGPHAEDSTKPPHGFVRTRQWALIACEDDGASIDLRFELQSDDESLAQWPHAFEAIVEIRLGAELHLSSSATIRPRCRSPRPPRCTRISVSAMRRRSPFPDSMARPSPSVPPARALRESSRATSGSLGKWTAFTNPPTTSR